MSARLVRGRLHRRYLMGTAGLVVVVLLTAGSCSDDLARAGANSDELIRAASRYWDEIAVYLSRTDESGAIAVVRRVEGIDNEIGVPSHLEAAFNALMWDVGCDAVFGGLPTSADQLAPYLAQRAASFGIQFIEDGAQITAEALLQAMTGDDPQDASQAC